MSSNLRPFSQSPFQQSLFQQSPFQHSPGRQNPFRTSLLPPSHLTQHLPLCIASTPKDGWTPPPVTVSSSPSQDVVRSSRFFDANRPLSTRPQRTRQTGKSDRMSRPNLARLNLEHQDFGLENTSKPSLLTLLLSKVDWVAPTLAAVLVISVILAGVVSALT